MKPELVIQVAFADWTHGGILRQPRYLGLRQDRDPKTVVREEPAHTEDVVKETQAASARSSARRSRASRARDDEVAAVARQRLTHPDRVLFPHDGITKLQLAEYFAAVGEARHAALQGPAAVASCATRMDRSRSSRSISSRSRARACASCRFRTRTRIRTSWSAIRPKGCCISRRWARWNCTAGAR